MLFLSLETSGMDVLLIQTLGTHSVLHSFYVLEFGGRKRFRRAGEHGGFQLSECLCESEYGAVY